MYGVLWLCFVFVGVGVMFEVFVIFGMLGVVVMLV